MTEPRTAAVARTAVASLRGYVYQTLAAALAWLDLADRSKLYLEVTEDYAVVARDAVHLTQVKDTAGSGRVTLHTKNVRDVVARFVALSERDPSERIFLRFLTTSEIGNERPPVGLPSREAGLSYWRRCATRAEVQPLREVLEARPYSQAVHDFCRARTDTELRRDLFRRIHWDCGRPDFRSLRRELEARLVVLGKDRFGVVSAQVPTLADSLLCTVLEKSILSEPEERVLTRADLYSAIDAATMVSMPQAAVRDLVHSISAIKSSLNTPLVGIVPPIPISESIIENHAPPAQSNVISRRDLENSVSDVLLKHGVCLITGSSGVGKSTLARSVSLSQTARSHTLDFRHLDAEESRRRLDATRHSVADLHTDALTLEDLNVLHDAQVVLSLGRVLDALRRCDVRVTVTCYRCPSQISLGSIGIGPQCVVPCGYFSLEECARLVHKYGGDGNTWARIAHRAGSNGHPQLVHAVVGDMAARGWPRARADGLGTRTGASFDVDAVKEDARRVIATLPRDARKLLYRLSLSLVHFTRSTALAIGALPPALPRGGECLDRLVGPWVERIDGDLYRVSPLASQIGQEMLTGTSELSVHRAFAVETLRSRRLVVSDVSGIFGHAMKSKAEGSLVQLAFTVVTAEGANVTLLAEHFGNLRNASSAKYIYPDSPKTSVMLRIAQMKLLAEARGQADMTEVIAAMFDEIDALSEESLRSALEAFALGNILALEDAVNRVGNWVALLMRAEQASRENVIFGTFASGIQQIADVDGASGVTLLWNIGITNVASVRRLEQILEDLDGVDESVRSAWLVPVDEALADYSVWISGVWSTEEATGGLNPEDAAARYKRMAARTRGWNEFALSLQCSVAEAVLLDQYMEDREGALSVLAEAEEAARDHPILLRARAGIHYRHEDYETALVLFRRVVGRIDDGNPVEQAFALREAAISAAQCEQWEESERWFLQAQRGARRVGNRDMDVMATALEADLAAVALLVGNTSDAIRRFAQALRDSENVGGQETLVWGYCQRVVRHAVIWCFNRIEGKDFKGASGEPIVFEPGMCSNPNPIEEILNHPLGPLDTVWYMLAQAELTAGVDVGIQEKLEDVLRAGRIPVLDAALRWRKMRRNIRRLDADSLARDLVEFLESEKYLFENRERIAAEWNAMEPERGEIPSLDVDALGGATVESTARKAIVAFAMHAIAAGQPEAIDAIERALTKTYGGKVPCGQVVEELKTGDSQGSELDQAVVETIVLFRRKSHMNTEFFWGASFCFFRWADMSDFKENLTAALAVWLRDEWTKIVEEEAFRLISPASAIPRIREVLKVRENSREFVLGMLAVTLDATLRKGRSACRRAIQAMLEE